MVFSISTYYNAEVSSPKSLLQEINELFLIVNTQLYLKGNFLIIALG
jgi:hypothetical protein